MRYTEQKKFIDALKRFEKKFSQDELKNFKMFVKRVKDGEDLDNNSFGQLKKLYEKYYLTREKPDLNSLFKKKE
ncbi:MAG: hypothetical protein CR986_06715 [Ignavibacteriae bacterium]|nr:MAG: hypothetical protein CR986_06715 [Ignavibacteriota bacterium]